jgi:hypothetical protein
VRLKATAVGLATLIVLAGCATQPTAPTVGVMPAPNKPLPEFQADHAVCKQWADSQVAGQAQAANNQALGGAAIGTLLGAGLGAAIGAAAGSPGIGAAVGAASGATLGTAAGANSSAYANMPIQDQYNIAYSQCMYAKGNQVPMQYQQPPQGYSAPPQGYNNGPPPGYNNGPPPPQP